MLEIILVDKKRRIITLDNENLTVQTDWGKTITSNSIEKYLLLYVNKEIEEGKVQLVFQLPPHKSIACEFDLEQLDSFNMLCDRMEEKCEKRRYYSFSSASKAIEETALQKRVRELMEERDEEAYITDTKKLDNQAHCPRCGSTSLSANKKGFGVGWATVGTLAFGLVPGLLIGSAGSKKIEVTCLKCGKKFKV